MADNVFEVQEGFGFEDGSQILPTSVDPSSSGLAAPVGSTAQRDTGEIWIKTGAGDTDWTLQPKTLDQAVDNGGSTDGAITITSGGSITVQSGASLTVADAPSGSTDVVNKNYADGIAAGVRAKPAVRAATTAALVDAYTYNNGTAGVGATLTKTTNGAFPAQDTITLVANDLVLIKDESGGNAPYNGIYEVTTIGDGSNPWQLTRIVQNDEADEQAGALTFVNEGSVNVDTKFVCYSDPPITMGTTDLLWTAYSSAESITAGAGITYSGGVISITDQNKGVQSNAAGNGLEVDASEIAGDGLKQNVTNSYVLDIEPADFAGNGLEDDGSDDLQVKADVTGGANLASAVNVSANGVAIKVDDNTVGENGSNQLEVKHKQYVAGTNVDPSSGYVLDQVAVATYSFCTWQVVVNSNATPANIRGGLINGINDGSTGVDDSGLFGLVKSGSAIPGLGFSVDISGGNMRLIATATQNIDFNVCRMALA